MIRVGISSLLAHKLRLLLTAFAIVIGIAFVSGTNVLSDAINATFNRIFMDAYNGVAVVVTGPPQAGSESNGGGNTGARQPVPLDQSVVASIRHVAGVQDAEGGLFRIGAVVLDRNGKPLKPPGPPTFGASWPAGQRVTLYPLRAGSAPHGPGQLAMDVATARTGNLSVGDSVRVVVAGGEARPYRISGIVGFGSGSSLGGASLVLWDLPVAQAVFNAPGKVDAITVFAHPGTPDTTVRDRVAAALPARDHVVTGGDASKEQSQQIQQGLSFLSTFLLAFAGIALFVGAFLIINTFNILVGQRTRELALLRALGASRAQVLGLVLVEALVTGLIASAVGVLAGWLLAAGVVAALKSSGSEIPVDHLVLSARTVVTALLVGTVVTVLSALFPARRATRIAPVAALREASPELATVSRRRTATGLLGIAAGTGVLLLGLAGRTAQPLALLGLGAAVLFIGVSVSGATIFPPIVRVIAWPARRWRGVPGELAGENALRNPRRTAATATALIVGVALVSGSAVLVASLKQSVNDSVTGGLRSDLMVSSTDQNLFGGAVVSALRATGKFSVVTPVGIGFWLDGGKRTDLAGADPAVASRVISLSAVAGSSSSFVDRGVAVGESAATAHGWVVGDRVTMRFPDNSSQALRVDVIYRNNGLLGPYIVPLSLFEAHTPDAKYVAVLVNDAGGTSPSAGRGTVQSVLGRYPTLTVQTPEEFVHQQSKDLDGLLNIFVVLLVFTLFIALIGVVNTLALSVLERTREIGLLRALGLGRRQTRTMIRWESITICVLGAIVGTALGIALAYALVHALASQGLSAFSLPVGQLVGYVVISAIAGVVAAIFPARRAARLNVLDAIAFE